MINCLLKKNILHVQFALTIHLVQFVLPCIILVSTHASIYRKLTRWGRCTCTCTCTCICTCTCTCTYTCTCTCTPAFPSGGGAADEEGGREGRGRGRRTGENLIILQKNFLSISVIFLEKIRFINEIF